MATNFPTSKDDGTSLAYPTATSARNSPSLSGLSDNQNDSIIALETKLGTGASTAASSKLLIGTGAGTSAWTKDAPTGTIVGTSDSQTMTNKTFTSPTINSPTITNATINTDLITGYSVATSGTVYGIQVSTGNVAMGGTLGVTGATTLTGAVSTVGQLSVQTGTAPPSAGLATAGILFSSTASLGLFYSNGAPTFSAAKGSLCVNTVATTTTSRLYINSSGSTTWTTFTTAA